MVIKVLFFAQFREMFGVSELDLRLEKGQTVRDAVQKIRASKKDLKIDWVTIKYAVNEEFAEPSCILNEGDTLVMLPPVSGG